MPPQLRKASPSDIPVLVRHRGAMMNEIAAVQDKALPEEDVRAMEAAYGSYLEKRMAADIVHAWVIEQDGTILCSGVISPFDWPPGTSFPIEHGVAFLHSLYTEPAHRRQGHAREVCEAAIAFCRERGVNRIILGASKAGRRLYSSLGFEPWKSGMRLML